MPRWPAARRARVRALALLLVRRLPHAPMHAAAPHTVMQCGKGPDGEYRLDFRYPVAPVQAFAAMLSAFAWKKP